MEMLTELSRMEKEANINPDPNIHMYMKEDHEEVRVVVGKNRHAWILGKISETDAINMISEIFVKFFMKGGREEGESPQREGEFMPVGLDGSVILFQPIEC